MCKGPGAGKRWTSRRGVLGHGMGVGPEGSRFLSQAEPLGQVGDMGLLRRETYRR